MLALRGQVAVFQSQTPYMPKLGYERSLALANRLLKKMKNLMPSSQRW